jgi:hypothetical protein
VSRRSVQAVRLGNDLTARLGVRVEVLYEPSMRRGDASGWYVEWADGPTVDEMWGHVGEAARAGGYDELVGLRVGYSRGQTALAWAARAVAARRDGSLEREMATRLALGHHQPPRWGSLTPEELAVLFCVETRIAHTSYPERASAPEDEALIAELLDVGEHNEHKMASVLVNDWRVPQPAAGRPPLKAVADGGDDTTGGVAGPVAVLGVAETATAALAEQQARAALGLNAPADPVAAVRAAVEASVYWPAFIAAVRAGEVDEHHPDLPSGPVGRLLPIWARQAPETGGTR